MNLQLLLKQITIILLYPSISCNHITIDTKTTLRGDEVIGRLQYEAKKIDNFYFTTNFKNSLPYQSKHNWGIGLAEGMSLFFIKIDRDKNYQKEGVDECVNNIRTIGFPAGGVPALLTCDIREVGFIEIGGVGTGGEKTRRNNLLLNLLALP